LNQFKQTKMNTEKKTFQELLSMLIDVYVDVEQFAYETSYGIRIPNDFQPELNDSNDWRKSDERSHNYIMYMFGTVICVAEHGGEGKGEDWWKVFHFIDHDVYIKVQGFYQSYSGTEFYDGWDSCTEVKPQEVVVTVYN